mmetsp:Transcript_71714/g.149692  ORF Transcript_71714/g.149692 Transcript_71714/m.149692 type:complete len:88 (-) Transcript_71714:531-794(-)
MLNLSAKKLILDSRSLTHIRQAAETALEFLEAVGPFNTQMARLEWLPRIRDAYRVRNMLQFHDCFSAVDAARTQIGRIHAHKFPFHV